MSKELSWAVCRCFFDRNIFLRELGHVTFHGPKQFQEKYAHELKGLDKEKILADIFTEITRRKQIIKRKFDNIKRIKREYTPLYPEVFQDNFFNLLGFDKGVKNELPGIYSFPLVSNDQTTMLAEEIQHFKKSGLPYQQPNSMNKNGLLMEELGFDQQIKLIVDAIEPLIKEKFPDMIGSTGIDSFKAFTVEYSGDGDESSDVELATHFDNAEVTLNIPLAGDYDGSELYFQTKAGYSPVEMCVGRALLHSGRHLHGVLPITEGYRLNLIIWMRSSEVRNRKCPMCNEEPTLEEVEHGKGDGFTVPR